MYNSGQVNKHSVAKSQSKLWKKKTVKKLKSGYHLYFQVKFHEKLILQEINIYETYHAGGVKRVLAKDPAGKWLKLYETNQVQNIAKSRIFSPTFTVLLFTVSYTNFAFFISDQCNSKHVTS